MKCTSVVGRNVWGTIPLLVSLLFLGCVKKGEGEVTPSSKDGFAEAAKTVLKASKDDCVGPLIRSGKPKEIDVGDLRFTQDGYLLSQLTKDSDEELVLGILSDTKENTPENRRNLSKIVDFFRKEKVQAIIHLGDVAGLMPLPGDIEIQEKDAQGRQLTEEEKSRLRRRATIMARRTEATKSYEGIVEMISILAEMEVPVFVIGGNRECKTTFNSALATLSRDFPNVFNMNLIRRVDLDEVDIISMPGYHDPEYVHCPWDACIYYESDTLSLAQLASETQKPILVISHGPPRQKDRNGIDMVSEGVNVGNPWLTAVIEKAHIAYGAFGNIQEAGGKATNLDGSSLVTQNTFVDSLYLNPGPADSSAWGMNDGTESHGMAAILHFVGKKAKYKIYHVGAEEKATK